MLNPEAIIEIDSWMRLCPYGLLYLLQKLSIAIGIAMPSTSQSRAFVSFSCLVVSFSCLVVSVSCVEICPSFALVFARVSSVDF